MDGLFKRSLKERGRRVEERVKKCRRILNRLIREDSYTPDDELELGLLKQAVDSLAKEIKSYMQRKESSSKTRQTVHKLFEVQYTAEDLQIRLQMKINEINEAKNTHGNSTLPDKEMQSVSSKLPELKIGVFDGDILKWHGFWDQFMSMIGNRTIAAVDKMMYLRDSLRGDALEVIKGLDLTNANYEIAINRLAKTYGRPGHVIDEHYRALSNIPKATDDISNCRRTLNKLEGHLSILESMGEIINANNSLRHIILDKFPNELMFNFRMGDHTDNQSIEQIRLHLERVISSREMSMPQRSSTDIPCSETELHISSPIGQFTTESLFAGTKKGENSESRSNPNKRPASVSNSAEPPSKRTQNKTPHCLFCSESHFADMCQKFSTLDARKNLFKGRCFICFSRTHLASNHTGKKVNCAHCNRQSHHRSLCPQKFGSQKTNIQLSIADHETVLPTAIVRVYNPDGRSLQCRMLLDTGSQRTYINSQAAKLLKLCPIETTNLTIYSFGNAKPQVINAPLVSLKIQGLLRDIEISAYVVPTTTGDIPSFMKIKQQLSVSNPTIPFAPDVSVDAPADLILGSDFFHLFVSGERREILQNLFILKTVVGWVVSGRFPDTAQNELLSVLTYVSTGGNTRDGQVFQTPDPAIERDTVKDIWELETIGIMDSPKILRDEEVVQYFNKTIQRIDGRYFVKWPWVEYPPTLPINLGQAIGRLRSLLRYATPELLQNYNDVLQEQLQKHIIEIINTEELPDHPVHYLPHHGVVQEDKSTKLRIVYDGSAKLKGHHSLNELLYKGPSLLEDLTSLLIQFRQHRVGIVSDIEKAFLQIGLQTEDRDVTRFLWVKDIDKGYTENNLLHLRFCRVPFGIISSPFLLSATIRYHLAKTASPIAQILSNHLYVDNLVTGVDNLTEATTLYTEARRIFSELSMNIREWNSNNHEFLKQVPLSQRAGSNFISVLGLKWSTSSDTLSIGINAEIFHQSVSTKRGVLKLIASIFDPCGWCAPYTLPTRIFLQSLWEDKVKWDTPLSKEQQLTWSDCKEFLKAVVRVELPRFYLGDLPISLFYESRNELHCFVDASQSAYVAAVYLRSEEHEGFKVNLIISKSRLTPLKNKKSFTIPKLELLGLLIGSRLVHYVQKHMCLPLQSVTVWSDSTIVLSWLKSERLLPPFVYRRVTEINKLTNVQFKYIPSRLNPADIATRRLDNAEVPQEWFEGPRFLREPANSWPVYGVCNSPFPTGASETQKLDSNEDDNHETVMKPDSEPPKKTSRTYASITQPVRDVGPVDLDDSALPDHGYKLEKPAIRKLQESFFPKECNNELTPLAKSLGLFLDEEGILRCKGRFANADFTVHQKRPILLPKNSRITALLIQRIHETNYHVGVSHTLSLVRTMYWIPQGRAKVSSVIRMCKECIRQGGGPYKLPDMPDLPAERVSYSPPFTFTGLDYFGPLTVVENGNPVKRYGCLFTCMAVRAVHLELVKDLTGEEFLLGLRRFIATRGVPQLLVSDNATHFKMADSIIHSPLIQGHHIKWRFIPSLSPWQGGFYERMVGLVKHCLYRSIGNALLGEHQLGTVLKEIEAVINSRPLTTVGKDLETVLTPAHFLKTATPQLLEITANPSRPVPTSIIHERVIDSWRRTSALMEQFRLIFINQYLTTLREHHTVTHSQPRVLSHNTPEIGDIVQIKGDKANRAHWKVGRISSLLASLDGKIRTARVTLPCGQVWNRSVSHLYPLELKIDAVRCANNPSVVPGNGQIPTAAQDTDGNPVPTHSSYYEDTAADGPGIEGSLRSGTQIETSLQHDSAESRKSSRAAARLANEKIRGWIHSLFSAAVTNNCH